MTDFCVVPFHTEGVHDKTTLLIERFEGKCTAQKKNHAYMKRKSIRIRLVVKVSCTCTWVNNLLHCFHVHKGQHNKCISKWYSVIHIIDMQSTSNRRGSHLSRRRSKAMRCPLTYSTSMLHLHAWMLMTDVNLCCQNNVLNAKNA